MKVRLTAFLDGDDGGRARDFYSERVPQLKASGDKLAKLFGALRPLAGGRRREKSLFYPMGMIEDALALFENHQVEFKIATTAKGMDFWDIRKTSPQPW